LTTIEKLRPAGEQAPQQQRQEPTMDPQQAPQQAPQQQKQQRAPTQSGGVAQAFQTGQKPKGRMGQNGFEYTFNSFLQDTHGEQINEGVWDFVKGAGAAVGGKIRDKINAYADQPSVLKDIYHAGKAASQAGDARAQGAKYQQAIVQAKQLRDQLRQMLQQLGKQAPAVLAKAVSQYDPKLQMNLQKHLMGSTRGA
jgi:hypothetical protein